MIQEETERLILKLDADAVRLSAILQLKDAFRAFPGKSPIELHFLSRGLPVGVISIDAQWGVQVGPALLEKLKQFEMILY